VTPRTTTAKTTAKRPTAAELAKRTEAELRDRIDELEAQLAGAGADVGEADATPAEQVPYDNDADRSADQVFARGDLVEHVYLDVYAGEGGQEAAQLGLVVDAGVDEEGNRWASIVPLAASGPIPADELRAL
jgi:hypothetical protein